MVQATRYYGDGPSSGQGARFTAPVIGLMVASVVIGVSAWSYWQRSRQIAETTVETHAAAIAGPPCPQVRDGAFRQPLKPSQTLFFDGVTFGRRFGQADCSVMARKSAAPGLGYTPLCQFSSPAVLSVSTPRGRAWFEPGLGQEATVFVEDGVARCVLAAPYWKRYYQIVTHTGPDGRPLPLN